MIDNKQMLSNTLITLAPKYGIKLGSIDCLSLDYSTETFLFF